MRPSHPTKGAYFKLKFSNRETELLYKERQDVRLMGVEKVASLGCGVHWALASIFYALSSQATFSQLLAYVLVAVR